MTFSYSVEGCNFLPFTSTHQPVCACADVRCLLCLIPMIQSPLLKLKFTIFQLEWPSASRSDPSVSALPSSTGVAFVCSQTCFFFPHCLIISYMYKMSFYQSVPFPSPPVSPCTSASLLNFMYFMCSLLNPLSPFGVWI